MTTITAISPLAGSHDAPIRTDIAAMFDQEIDGATATAQTFVVQSARGSLLAGDATVTTDGPTVIFSPSEDFFAGEIAHVSVTSGIRSAAADPVVPRVWQFRTAVTAGSGQLNDSGQSLGDRASRGVSLGDLDGDGDLDAFVVNTQDNRVWLNDGTGVFTDSGQGIGDHFSNEVALGDLDGDGDLDAFVANRPQANRVWLNDGSANFTDTGQGLGDHDSRDVQLGDLDGDGDLDAFVATAIHGHRVWLNDGDGIMSSNGQILGNHYSYGGAALGDLDGDGDLDALVAHTYQANRLWLNDGSGVFTDSGQLMGNHASNSAQLGDLDGDGDLDALVDNWEQGNRVWLNAGDGVLVDSGQSLGNHGTDGLALGDLDGDGDLDAFAANSVVGGNAPNRVWLNDGSGVFTDSNQILGNQHSRDVALGDLDGDGDLDAFVANGLRSGGNRVWLNQNLTPSVLLSLDTLTLAEDSGGAAVVTATLSAIHTDAVIVELDTSGSATPGDDYTLSGTQIEIPPGTTSGSVTLSAVPDVLDEPDETVIVDVSGVINGQEFGVQQVTLTILDDDEPVMPDVTLTVDAVNIPEGGGIATFTASLSEVTTIPITVDLAVASSSTATQTADFTASSLQISIAPGSTGGSVTVTAVQDETDEPDETVTLEITRVTGGNELGQQTATATILDDDLPPSFRLSSFGPTSGGFVAELSAPVDASVLNLSEIEGHGPADATLIGATTGPVAGSLVVSADGRKIEFLATGDRLATDTYTVTLRSANNGFKDTLGNLLDGNADGTGGDDFSDTFTVASNTSEIGVQDFVRGPGQELNLPADSADGIPMAISSDGAAIRNASFAIDYNPDLLDVTAVVPGASMPAGSTAAVDASTPGRAVVTFSSPIDLPTGLNTLVNLQANVPTTNAAVIYGQQHVLDINSITLTNAVGTELPAVDNDSLHVVAFFGDVSGNGGINASDASQVARLAGSLDSGFAEFLLTDPMIVGDISGNRVINATDASMVARYAVELPVDEIPPIPGGVVIASSGRVSPKQSLGIMPTILVPSPVTVHDRLKAPPASAALGFTVPVVVPHAAIDAMMTRLASPEAADSDELPLALEEAVEQLLAASQTLATG